jgi:hypothetical protein
VLAASVATGAAITFFADAAGHGQLAPRGGLTGIGLVVAVALSSSVLGTSAFMAGVRQLGASRASIVSSAEPALTAAFAFAAFGDRFGTVQLLGAGLVLASVPILELKRTRSSERSPRRQHELCIAIQQDLPPRRRRSPTRRSQADDEVVPPRAPDPQATRPSAPMVTI